MSAFRIQKVEALEQCAVTNPFFEQVSEEDTGAYEAIEIIYGPAQATFEDLLNVFWITIDPTQSDGKFGGRVSQYLTGIFYQNEEEKMIAEEYRQDYYKKNATHYNAYSVGSGREGFLDKTWEKKPYCPLRRISLEKVKEIEKHKK